MTPTNSSKQSLRQTPSLTPSQSTESSNELFSPKLVRFDTDGSSSGYFASQGSSGYLRRSGNFGRNGEDKANWEEDEDLRRAKTLVQLVQLRGKFQQMGDTGLSRAKEKVDGVVSRYAAQDLDEKEKIARGRFLGVPSV